MRLTVGANMKLPQSAEMHAGHNHVIVLRRKLIFPSEHGGQAQATERELME